MLRRETSGLSHLADPNLVTVENCTSHSLHQETHLARILKRYHPQIWSPALTQFSKIEVDILTISDIVDL